MSQALQPDKVNQPELTMEQAFINFKNLLTQQLAQSMVDERYMFQQSLSANNEVSKEANKNLITIKQDIKVKEEAIAITEKLLEEERNPQKNGEKKN